MGENLYKTTFNRTYIQLQLSLTWIGETAIEFGYG